MVSILMRGYVRGDYELEDDIAILCDFNDEYINRIAARIRRVKTMQEKDKSLCCVDFWDLSHVSFWVGKLTDLPSMKKFQDDDMFEKCPYLVLTAEQASEIDVIDDPDDILRTDCEIMRVYSDGVYLRAYIKNSDVLVESPQIFTNGKVFKIDGDTLEIA